jgi:hypothetical protein
MVVSMVRVDAVAADMSQNERNKRSLLKYLQPALQSLGGIARLNYATTCYAKDGSPMPFPKIKTQAAEPGKMGLAVIESVFRGDSRVFVKARAGMVEITVGDLPREILETRIHSVRFERIEQYNPTMAINAIESTVEVKLAMRQGGYEFPVVISDMLVVTPEEGRPHLPQSLRELTLGQALDLIAKTFGGISTYGVCSQSETRRLVYLGFIYKQD